MPKSMICAFCHEPITGPCVTHVVGGSQYCGTYFLVSGAPMPPRKVHTSTYHYECFRRDREDNPFWAFFSAMGDEAAGS